jgi:uncharacterized protein YdaU (DUF1376 family)
MSAPPWMPLYIGDFVADTAHLGATETGIYIRLLMHCWQHKTIPTDDRKLALIAHCDSRLWHQYRETVLGFFDAVDASTMQHKRVSTELLRSEEISSKRKAAALQKHSKSSANEEQLHTQLHLHTQSQRKIERKQDAPNGAFGFSERDCRSAELDLLTEAVNGKHADLPDGSKAELERQLFRRGKQVLGPDTGGLIKKLLNAKQGVVAHAQAAIEMASTKENPREYIGAIIRGQVSPEADQQRRIEEFRRERKTAVVFATDVPGGIPGIR